MNVLILTPDRVGSTLLQRLTTIYMLRRGFDKPVINLHELTNGLEKYYNKTMNQEVLGKPNQTNWGYFQSLEEITDLLKYADHYKTSRLAHYHIIRRRDSIDSQIKFYEYLNENFFIISCRRENLFEHALSWAISGHSKKLNVYNATEKIDIFHNIYKNGITIEQPVIEKYLRDYQNYIIWTEQNFNVQSYFNYDTDVLDIEKYILNLDFMQGHQDNTWADMFGQDFNSYNACHRLLPNLVLSTNQSVEEQRLISDPISELTWNKFKGADWPEFDNANIDQLPVVVKKEITDVVSTQKIALPQVIHTTREIAKFLDTNLPIYRNTSMQLESLITDGFLVTSIPIKLQSLKEKKDIVKNFDQCIVWYNEWVDKNQFGNKYSESTLNEISKQEEQKLQLPIVQQNLLR